MTPVARLALFATFVFALWAAAHALIAWRLSQPMTVESRRAVAWVTVLTCVSWIPMMLWSRGLPSAHPLAWVRALTWLYFGVFSVVIALTVARELLLVAVSFAERAGAVAVSESRRRFLEGVSAGAVVAGAAFVGAAGWRGASRIAPVVRVDVPIAGLDPRLDGLRIAQITDIHIGQPLTRRELEAIVERTNAIGADLIAVTGDLVDGRVEVFADDINPIAMLRAPLGVFFVTGNHEYYSGAKSWERVIRDLGLEVLTNEHRVVEHQGAMVVVAGVTDLTAGQFVSADASSPARAFAGAPAAALNLLLAHQPKSVVAAAQTPAQLQLSGHTHGGQYWPFTLLIDAFHPVSSGLSVYGGMLVYVSRGTGVWGPRMRLGAPNEITELVLRAA